jgi:carboxymethylenebutenolidase
MKTLTQKSFFVSVVLLLAVSSFAATGKPVSYKSGDETVQGILYSPQGAGPFPAIVVIHEYWGLNAWIKEQASKLADEGYVTLAVDLYRGKVATTPDMGHELMRGVPEDRAGRDLRSAVGFLRAQSNVKKDRVGSIGWCMGGGYSLQTALEVPDLAATVINYGHLVTEPENLKKIHAAILGLFGGKDQGITPEDVGKFEAAMKQLGKKIDVKIYPEAGHAFENPNNKAGYRPDDAADAWKLTVSFLDANLKSR